MGPGTRARDPLAPQLRPRTRAPTEQFTLVGLNRKKRSYDIVEDHHLDKHGFLTLRGQTPKFKGCHKDLLEGAASPFTSTAEEGSKEQCTEERNIKGLQEQFSLSHDQSKPHLETVTGPATVRSLKQIESVEPPVSQKPEETNRRLKAEEVTPGVLQSITPERRFKVPDKERVVFPEESKVGLGQVNIFPGKAGEELRSAQGQVHSTNGSKPAQSQVEAVAPFTIFIQEPTAVPARTAFTPNNSTLEPFGQPVSRGLKRSRSPEIPILILSALAQSSHQRSPQPSATARRTPPSKPGERPYNSGIARGRKSARSAVPCKIVIFNTKKLPHGWVLDPLNMAPVRDPTDVSNKIKDVIQNLYDVQSQTHGFVPETQDLLIDKIAELTQSLAELQRLTDKNLNPNNPVQNIDVAPEIVDYVDDGRNPDIFTRDFVELVQRGNAVVNGKKQAFRDFSVVYAKALKEGIGGVERHVDAVMERAGIEMRGEGEGKENGEKVEEKQS